MMMVLMTIIIKLTPLPTGGHPRGRPTPRSAELGAREAGAQREGEGREGRGRGAAGGRARVERAPVSTRRRMRSGRRGGGGAGAAAKPLATALRAAGARGPSLRPHRQTSLAKQSGAIRSHQAPSGAIRSHQEQSGAIRSQQEQSGAIRSHQKPSGAHTAQHDELARHRRECLGEPRRRRARHGHVSLAERSERG